MIKEVINDVRVVVSNVSLQAEPTCTHLKEKAAKRRQHQAVCKKSLTPELTTTGLALADLRKAGGIVTFSSWSTGIGNHIKAKAIPVGAKVWCSYDPEYSHLNCPEQVKNWFKAHPRAKRCVALETL
jgi:hypothetical protein